MKLLEGIRVIEFATHVVVPAAARMLSDWGAEVIKVESLKGDPWRNLGQTFELPIQGDCNPMYAVCNSGKRLLSLDLKTPEGKNILFRLLEKADIFMTNVRWASIERLGLDYDSLHTRFPQLVYMHFNGYGYEGPDSARPGFDANAFWASSGAIHEFHEPGQRPGPVAPPGFGDTASSGPVLSGVLGGLIWRMKTGEGIRVTSSLYANGIWCNHNRIVGEQARDDGAVPPQYPRRPEDTANPFSHIYECRDGEWISIVGTSMFRREPARVLRAFELGELVDDIRYTKLPFRPEDARTLYRLCVERLKRRSVTEWDVILNDADIPHQKLEHSGDVADAEQAWANDYLTKMVCPNGRTFTVPNSPVTFFGFEKEKTRHAGAVGTDTREILLEEGFTAEEIEAFRAAGAIGLA